MVDILAVAARRSDWLTQRQTLLARNVANINTPGYRAEDVRPFADLVESFGLTLAASQPGHITGDTTGAPAAARARTGQTWDGTVSGNNVNVDEELIKTNEVSRAMALNTAVVRGFHRMIMANIKG
jgi:flagellar basal-body rod protein FlgB